MTYVPFAARVAHLRAQLAAKPPRRVAAASLANLEKGRRRKVVEVAPAPKRRQPASTGPCVDCGRMGNPYGYVKGRCHDTCYHRWLYRTSKERRTYLRDYGRMWRRLHPEAAREAQQRANRKYREKVRRLAEVAS